MPTDLTTALRNRHSAGTPQAPTTIRPDPLTYVRTIPTTMSPRKMNDPLEETIALSNGVMTRVRMVNATLRHLRIDCSELDALAGNGVSHLATAQDMLMAQNRSATRFALARFQGTVTSLRDTYRQILVHEDLPGDTAQGVLAVAQSLDVTAVRAGSA
jgi:hypothetical protein